jgi:hypothetical protein
VPAIDQFVGRNEDLNTLWALLQPSGSSIRKVAVLHGLGGIGKTQLAIRFARIYRDDFSAIFWLNGKSQETLMHSLADLLPRLPDIDVTANPKTEEELEQAAREVLQWLAKSANSRWLLIYDNIDQYSRTKDANSEAYDVTQFFPSTDHGSIIITTRVSQLAEVGQSFPIRKLQSDEATTLLMNSAGSAARVSKGLSPLRQGQRESLVQLTALILNRYGDPDAAIRRTSTGHCDCRFLYAADWDESFQVP